MDELKAVMVTTHLDSHGMRFTKGALDGMARDIGQRPVRTLVDHDRTLPPWGRITHAAVVPMADGEYSLVGTIQPFEAVGQVVLPDGQRCVRLGPNDGRPLARPKTADPNKLGLWHDSVNFASNADLLAFLGELESLGPYDGGTFGRKSAVPVPEIIIQVPTWLLVAAGTATALVAKRVVDKVADQLATDIAQDMHRLYMFLTRAPAALLRHAIPKDRPATCIYYVATDPWVEFVVTSSRPETFVEAIDLAKLKGLVEEAGNLKDVLGASEVQYRYSDTGTWALNYFLTQDGSVIGTQAAIDAGNKRLELMLKESAGDLH